MAALVAVLMFAAVSQAQTGTEQLVSSWAKVNVCTPSQVGARAQLAGDGSKKHMYVRFTAQWLSDDGWVPIGGSATSPWLSAGTADLTWQQAGWTFNMNALTAGQTYQIRAVAELQWRNGGSVARSSTFTTGTCTVTG
ncbi:MAG TPA: hypothetical protein VGF25_09995 [Thermoleophilaceae bacterium]